MRFMQIDNLRTIVFGLLRKINLKSLIRKRIVYKK